MKNEQTKSIYHSNKTGLFFTLLTIILAVAFSCNSTVDEKLPNIVIIFTDDQGYADVGCYGAKGFETPHLDKLAGQGLRFTDFYVSQAVCSASRAALLTGCYSDRVGIQGALGPRSKIGLNPEEETIPELLKKKDYATGIFGKWHLGHDTTFLPLNQGFDEYFGLPYSNDMWPVGYDGNPSKRKKGYPELPLIEGDKAIEIISDLEDQSTLSTRYAEKAVAFIKKNKDNPFFLYLPHSMPHVPLAVSEKFNNKSEQGMYGDVIMEIDWSVGQIMQALEDNGIADNTLVIFTSDNGPWMNFGNHAGSALPLREGKGTMWEGGVRVPCIMRWPGKIPAGTETDKIASTIDVLPTLAAVLDIPLGGKKIDGVDISSLMFGKEGANPRETFYYFYGNELGAVRQGDWKLCFPHRYRTYSGVEPGNDGLPGHYNTGECGLELYNLRTDIGESKDVAAQNPEIVEALKKIADQARFELGDRLTKTKGTEVREPGRLGPKRDPNINHIARHKKVDLKTTPHANYSGEGKGTLTNGVLGSFDFKDGQWLGFWGEDFEATLDLGAVIDVKSVKTSFLQFQSSWIFLPEMITLEVSEDGQNFEALSEVKNNLTPDYDEVAKVDEFKVDRKVQFIRVKAKNIGVCPDWHPGEGGKAWVFIDEIIVH